MNFRLVTTAALRVAIIGAAVSNVGYAQDGGESKASSPEKGWEHWFTRAQIAVAEDELRDAAGFIAAALEAPDLPQGSSEQEADSLVSVYGLAGKISADLRRYDEAIDRLKHGCAVALDAFGPIDRRTVAALHNLSQTHLRMGDVIQAARVAEVLLRALSKWPPQSEGALSLAEAVGFTVLRVGQYQSAGRLFASTLERREAKDGVNSPKLVASVAGLAGVAYRMGEFKDAEAGMRRAIRLMESLPVTARSDLDRLYRLKAQVMIGKGDLASAKTALETANKLRAVSDIDDPQDRAFALRMSAELRLRRGELEDAASLLEEADRSLGKAGLRDHPDLADVLHLRARVWKRSGKEDAAKAALRKAVEIRRRSLGRSHADTLRAELDLSIMLSSRAAIDAASLAAMREQLEILSKSIGKGHPDVQDYRDAITALNGSK